MSVYEFQRKQGVTGFLWPKQEKNPTELIKLLMMVSR